MDVSMGTVFNIFIGILAAILLGNEFVQVPTYDHIDSSKWKTKRTHHNHKHHQRQGFPSKFSTRSPEIEATTNVIKITTEMIETTTKIIETTTKMIETTTKMIETTTEINSGLVESSLNQTDDAGADLLDVRETTKIVQVGEPIEMMCMAPGKIKVCEVEIPGSKEILINDSDQLTPIPETGVKLAYIGDGFDRGQCGIRIDKATESLNGIFICSAYVAGEFRKKHGYMNVTVARTPTNPELRILDNKNNEFKEGDILKATCSVKKGRPATNFTWYLGDEVLYDGLNKPVFTTTSDDLKSTEQNLTRTIQASDDGKELKCVANHVGLNEQNKQVTKYLSVNFKPKSYSKPFERFGMVEGEEGRVSIEVEANPRPIFIWTIGGEQVIEGDSLGHYQVLKSVQKGSNHLWETSLVISTLTKDDVNKDYRIKATNKYGEAVYEAKISTNPEPEVISKIGTGTIIIVLIVIALVFLISCVILFARAKGRWCFAVGDDHGDSLPEKGATTGLQDPSEDPMAPRLADVIGRESSDTESAEHTTCDGRKKLSFPLVFKKKNDKLYPAGAENKDITSIAVIDEEDKIDTCLQRPEADGDQGQGVPTPSTANANDGEGVVYAELDLPRRVPPSPAAPVVRADQDKTEYAEIIHTPKPNDKK